MGKILTFGTAVSRVLGRRAMQTRVCRAALSAGRISVRSFLRVGHLLLLEVTGFFFLCLSAIGGLAFYREYRKYSDGARGPGRMVLAICFALMFLWFGITSMWRAKRRNEQT